MTSNNRQSHYACALILLDGKVLLGKRAPFRAAYPECWDVIGGKIEAGETAAEALSRELGEEIAIRPLAPEPFGQIKDHHANPDDPPTYHFFKVTHWEGGAPIMNNHEHTHLEWFTAEQACDLGNLALPEYRDLLRAALA